MMISNADWKNYIEKLSSLDKTAGDLMLKWVQKNGFSDSEALTDYAYALVTKYGEGSAALAAEMYDAVAEMSGKFYPPAETAPTPDYEDVAKAVNGTRRWSQNEKAVPNTVSRMVKQAGADTTLRNAIRDQAEFAWVPNGDTCAFCITLASNGWQPASNAVAKGGHAEHIHPNCDCTFAIRFDGKGGVKGYDPEKYKRMYDEAEGGNSKEKINSIRRMKYAENPEKYRAQSRAAYAERNRRLNYGQTETFTRETETFTARRVNKYSNNNLYIADDVSLSPKEIRWINNSITKAKEIMKVAEECDANFFVVNDSDKLAAYNPRTNSLYISSRMSNKKDVIELQTGYAASNNTNSTMVHELFHWKDADEYRKSGKVIDSAEPNSVYSIYQRVKAEQALENNGINLGNVGQIREISEYALEKAIANDYEEVYTEYRTKLLLEGV